MLALLVLVTSQANAVLRESERQLERRYGRPIKQMDKKVGPYRLRCYLAKEIVLVVALIERGRSVMEMYARTDRPKLPDRSIQAALRGNGGGKRWIASKKRVRGMRIWTLEGRTVVAALARRNGHDVLAVGDAASVEKAGTYTPRIFPSSDFRKEAHPPGPRSPATRGMSRRPTVRQ